jgi:hypothetical protein
MSDRRAQDHRVQPPVPLHVQRAAAAVVLALTAIGCASSAAPTAIQSPAAAAAVASTGSAAQPETEAGVRAAATAFYALYSAGQWPQAWAMLAPAAQQTVPESLYVAVHQGCPNASAGMARVIKSVTMAGSTAVVTEALSGAASALGSFTDAWTYADGRWGLTFSASDLAVYSHGSAAADIAAAKAAGDCAGAQPLPTFQTVAPLPTA